MTSPAAVRRLELQVGEFIASHVAAEGAVDFAAFRTDPIGFATDVLGVRMLWDAQRAHLRAVAESPRTCAYGANGTGKTLDDAILALWWIYCHDGLVIATSAKEAQLRDQFMREVRRLFHQAPTLPGELYTMALRRPERPEAGLLCQAAGDTNNLRGLHAPRVMVQLQEAQGLPDWSFQSAEMMAVGEADRVTASGNSSQPGGEFHRRVRSPAWRSVRFNALEHPNVTTGTVVIPGGPTLASIAQRAADYGTDSSFYLASVLGVFPEDSPGSLVERAWLEAAAERWAAKTLEGEAWGKPFVCGLDPARSGPDQTAFAVRQDHILRHLAVWSKLDTMETCGRVTLELERRGILTRGMGAAAVWEGDITLIIDVLGLGSGVYDRLHELGKYRLKEYQAGLFEARGKGPDMLNRRAADYWALRRLLEDGKIALPQEPELFDELTAIEWRVNSSGKIQLLSKDDLRAKLGRSTDRADAVSMVFSGVYRAPGGRSTVGQMDH